jgi:hypothetical protein
LTHWLIIRCDMKREHHVADHIQRMADCDAWVPTIKYLHAKKLPSAKSAKVTIKSRPLMATYVFAAVPMGSVGSLWEIDGYRHIECRSASWVPLSIPQIQIEVFRQMLDRENAITENQHRRQTENKRVKRVIKLGPEALAEVMQELFGIGADQEKEAA